MIRRWACLWVCVAAAALCGAGWASAAETVRISAAVRSDGAVDEALSDLWAAELSRQQGVEILARRELQLVLGEQSLAAAMDDSYRQSRLGRLLGVDAFAWIRVRDGRAVLEVVEAATGRGILVGEEPFDPPSAAKTLESLARKAVEAARRGPAAIDAGTPTLAVAQPVVDSEELAPAAQSILLQVAQELERKGVQRLHRELLKELVVERWMLEKDFTDAHRKDLAMLAARYVLACRVTAADRQLTLALLETRTGRRAGQRAWSLEAAAAPAGLAEIAEWVHRRLDGQAPTTQPQPATATAPADLPLQPEALAPFYRGVLLHNQGAYLEALEPLYRATRLDRRFRQPVEWIVSSFRSAGFEEIAEQFEAYLAKAEKDRWSGLSQPRALHAGAGAALVGITAQDQPASLRVAVMMRLIDGLHEATGAPVFVTEDMAELRDEYDALVGLEHVAGTTWRQAPPMLFADTLTAHLVRRDGKPALRLCAVHLLEAGSIAEVSIELGDDQADWTRRIAEGCRRLLGPAPEARTQWRRPPPILTQGPKVPKDLLRELPPFEYIKSLVAAPGFVSGLRASYTGEWFTDTMMPGLHRWFVRTLPDDNPAKPALVYSVAGPAGTRQDRFPLAHLEKLQQQYGDQPVGLLARLSWLLCRLDDDNLAQTQAELEPLLAKVRSCVPSILSEHDYQRWVDTNLLMRRALGMDHVEGKLDPGGPVWVQLPQGNAPQMRTRSGFPGEGKYPDEVGNPQARAIIDLTVYRCAWQGHDIPASVARKLYERFADQPDALAYFTVTYAGKLFSNRIGEIDADARRILVEIYPVHARTVVRVLDRKPLSLDFLGANSLTGVHPLLIEAGKKAPAFGQALQQVREALLRALDDGRLGPLPPVQIYGLLCNVYRQGDAEALPYIRKLADRSRKADPLQDRAWWVLAHWNPHPAADELLAIYQPIYQRVRELHPAPALDKNTVETYYDFAVVFFRAGRFDLAEEILLPISEWDSPDSQYWGWRRFRASACYLRALMRHRERNIPEALHLAQRTVELVGGDPIGLVYLGGGGMGSTSNLKSMANDLIAALRNHPDAPFVSPFREPPPKAKASVNVEKEYGEGGIRTHGT